MTNVGNVVNNIGNGIKKGADLAEKRTKLHLYIKRILPTPRRLISVVDKARTLREKWKLAEKTAYNKFKKDSQTILNGLSGTSKFALDSAAKLAGGTADFCLRFLGAYNGTAPYRNAAKSGFRMVGKGAHGLIHASLLGLRATTAKLYATAKSVQFRANYKLARNAALAAM